MPAVYLPPNFLRKAEAARSESQDAHAQGGEALFASSEGDGASDVEVFFTSQEEAKPPNILATGTGQCFR